VNSSDRRATLRRVEDTELDEQPNAAEAEIRDALADFPPLGPWVGAAACAGLGDLFTGPRAPDPEELAVFDRICRRCPVRSDCADYAARADVHGVWAGAWVGWTRRPPQIAA
jgi:hypothetical protein